MYKDDPVLPAHHRLVEDIIKASKGTSIVLWGRFSRKFMGEAFGIDDTIRDFTTLCTHDRKVSNGSDPLAYIFF